MKKLLSFVIFTALLIWTWQIVHSESNLGFETHAGIQNQLEQLIQSAVTAKKPTATDFTMQKLWTERLASNKVKAHFAYSFKDAEENQGAIEHTLEGEAVLYREASEATPNENGEMTDHWVLQNIKTTNDSFVFTEGMTLTPADATATPAPTEQAPPAEHKSHE